MAILTVVYLAAGKLGLTVAFIHPSATAVWPPTGIALAALMLLGYRVWPAIFIGAFLVNVTTAGSVATSLGIALGNTLEGVVGAYLVNRFANGCRAFDRARDVFYYLLLGALVSTTVSATFGVTSLCLGGFANWISYRAIWLTWWLGDAAGALIMAPVILLWSARPRLEWNRAQALEGALLILGLVLVSQVVFGGLLPTQVKNYPLAFLCIPFLVWAAFRFGPRETASACFLIAGLSIWGTLGGFGPFVRETQNESLLLLQTFLGVVTVTALALAASVSERKQGEERIMASLHEKEILLREIHHRVKNNLQVISSLLSLQARQVKDQGTLEMFKESQNRIRSIALVHEELHDARDLSQVDFASHIRSLTSHLFRSYGVRSDRVGLKIDVEDVFLSMDAAIPCSLLINELVSNSLKYAFPSNRKGEIRIDLRRGPGDEVKLIVGDNGAGLPKDMDFRGCETLGMQLINALSDQLGGTVELAADAGTKFIITFPRPAHGERRFTHGEREHPGGGR